MKKALKSDNQLNALINRNFIIRVLVDPNKNTVAKTQLTSANKLSNFINDEKLKLKLFNKVLDNGLDKSRF